MKACSICKVVKESSEFFKRKTTFDGLQTLCKSCAVRLNRQYQRAHPERILAKNKLRFSTPEASARATEWGRQARKRDTQKYRARTAITTALASGRITRRPCERCGNPKAEAHHEDYAKPLDVQWLCKFHHNERHLQMRGIQP